MPPPGKGIDRPAAGRLQADLGHAGGDVEANAALDTERLQTDLIAAAAYQDIGAEAKPHGSDDRHVAIVAREHPRGNPKMNLRETTNESHSQLYEIGSSGHAQTAIVASNTFHCRNFLDVAGSHIYHAARSFLVGHLGE